MPHKHNASRRHHIGKMKFKVTNWQEYEAGLRRRGSITLWITPDALAGAGRPHVARRVVVSLSIRIWRSKLR
jgi:hypothetical protein